MKTAGVAMDWLRALVGFCTIINLLINGSTAFVCYTTVESLDLGCLLQWDCPDASPNTTYTVQTKTQGDPWKDVSWCVWVSSRSCDISPAFSNFEVYNMIRLGVHLSPSSTIWIKPRKFDYSDFSFSPPSVAVSLQDDLLLVKVQFPCAASRRCSLKGCCPVSELIDPWTTVTVYNTLNQSDFQSRTVWSQEVVTYVDFSSLAPGQNYCAVANFSFPTFSMAASSKSAPKCVETVSKSGMLPGLFLGIGLTSLLVVPVLTVVLQRTSSATPATDNQPPNKTQVSIQDPVPLIPLSMLPVDPCDIHVQFHDDQVFTDSSSSSSCNQEQILTLGTCADPVQHESSIGAAYWDSGGLELEGGLDSGISIPPVSDD